MIIFFKTLLNLKKSFNCLFILSVIIFSLTISKKTLGYVNIYPVRFDKYIDKNNGDETFYLYNSTENTVRYRIYVDTVKGKENSDMSQWIEYYPKGVTLKPNEEKTIKVHIKAPKNTKAGEYSAILGVKEVPMPSENESGNFMDVYTDLRLEITGFAGNIKPVLNTENIKIYIDKNGEIKGSGVVQNIGDRRADFQFYLINSKGKEKCIVHEQRLFKDREIDLKDIQMKISDEEMKKSISKFDTFIIREKGRDDRNIEIFSINK